MADSAMQPVLEGVYQKWRQAMVQKDARSWSSTTSMSRKTKIRNQILSERKAFPAAVFRLPTAPPDLRQLTPARLRVKGPTAKAVYFGKVDFGVGGAPTDNIFVLSFVKEAGWKYDGADFINLMALPEIRKALANGDYTSLDKPEFLPSGIIPEVSPIRLNGPVPYIAKVYCYCPGREVTVQVNRKSRHSFGNTKRAEVVIGGANSGSNLIEYKIADLTGSTGKEPLVIRVYLMSESPGVKVPAVFEYLVPEGGAIQSKGQGTFSVTPTLASQLRP